MNDGVIHLFTGALSLHAPWEVDHVSLNMADGQVEFCVRYAAHEATCCHCGAQAAVGPRTQLRCWRHSDVFKFEALLYAELPVLQCGECGRGGVACAELWRKPANGWIEKGAVPTATAYA